MAAVVKGGSRGVGALFVWLSASIFTLFKATSSILEGPASGLLLLAMLLLLLSLDGDLDDDLECRERRLCRGRDAPSESRLSRRKVGDIGLRLSLQPPSRRLRKLLISRNGKDLKVEIAWSQSLSPGCTNIQLGRLQPPVVVGSPSSS